MRRLIFQGLLVLAVSLCGCSSTVAPPTGKSILKLSNRGMFKFMDKAGFANNYAGNFSRSSTGDLLFIQFQSPEGLARVVIISSNGITSKDLPGGFAQLDDRAEVVFWRSERERRLRFSNGITLATNVYWNGPSTSDSNFVMLFGGGRDHWWIASVQSPLEEFLTMPGKRQPQFVRSFNDKLHIFVMGPPEEGPGRKAKWVLKHYIYNVKGTQPELLQIQDFTDLWLVHDFDAESNLLYGSSASAEFAHGWLINTETGERKNTGYRSGYAIFLQNGVIKQFKEGLRGHVRDSHTLKPPEANR